jgi:uncharacterized protein involved in response to NO
LIKREPDVVPATPTSSPFIAHRLFFGLAAGSAIVIVGMTIAAYGGWFDWQSGLIGQWHGHEMIFGFALALMAGWFAGKFSPLQTALLVTAFLVSRMSYAFLDAALWVLLPGALIYPLLLFAFAGLPVLRAAKSFRNAVFGYILAALPLADLIFMLASATAWPSIIEPNATLAALLVALMAFTMGGRITAAATSGALQKRNIAIRQPAQPRLELCGVLIIAALAALHLTASPEMAVSALALGAAGIIATRLWFWLFWQVRDISVVCLHLGFAWLAVGFVLMAAAYVLDGFTTTDALHAVTVGALGTLSINIVTRVTLQRARRPLVLPIEILLALACVNLAAVLRLLAPLTEAYMTCLVASAAFWALAYFGLLILLCRRY